jgi:hypothetical protein
MPVLSNKSHAAVMLDINARQVRTLLKNFRVDGAKGYISKKLTDKLRKKVLSL